MRSEMFSGWNRPAPVPEMMKCNVFAQTCNKLSQFLKEKRSLGEFAFSSSMPEINGAKEICGSTNTMMNLFPKNMKKEGNDSTVDHNLKSLNLFPLISSSTAVNSYESIENNTSDHRELATIKEEPKTKTASMTIFYGGRVLVFEDLPEDKAREIMSLASQGMILPSTQTQIQIQIPTQAHPDNNVIITNQPSQGPGGSFDLLPIARRVSLHRFMEKRKNRIAASAPYPSQITSTGNYQEKYNMMMGNLEQRPEKEIELKLFQ